MQSVIKTFLILTAVVASVAAFAALMAKSNLAILNPAGIIAAQEKQLMIITVLLGLIVIIPVFVLTFWFAWRYREGNTKAKYQPELDGSKIAELIWWGIPTIIIVILSVITWNTSHSLDPHRPISSKKETLVIQVVALDWKWLFIYPREGIASVNHVQLPVDTPVRFDITADAPMNSFWIPQLGSQIYAMPGMSTKLHLLATKTGDYAGSSANISGEGFADMKFTARVSSHAGYLGWIDTVRQQDTELTIDAYNELAKPSKKHPKVSYATTDEAIYDHVLTKFLEPHKEHH